jgi:putative endopeptidase
MKTLHNLHALRTLYMLFVVSLFFGCCVASAQSNAAPAPPKDVKSLDLTSIDAMADPCTDFFQYACGNWVKNNPIPSDQVRWGTFSMLADRNRFLLWKELDSAARNPKTALQKQYGNFYASCMNTDLLDRKGIAPIDPALKKLTAFSDKRQLATLLTGLQAGGFSVPIFRVGVFQDEKDSTKQIAGIGQGGLSLPDRDYYLLDVKRFVTIRAQYLEHVKKMFSFLGDTPEQAATEAAAVLKIETALAKASMSRVELRDPEKRYHIKTIAELQSITPDFDWNAYIKGLPIGKFETLNVISPDFVAALNGQIKSSSIEELRSYLRWHVLHGAASSLTTPIDNENFEFFSKTLTGQKEQQPRWKRCTLMTDGAMGEAVGQDWVKENFPPAAKASMDKLVAALEKALGEDIQGLPWMTDATKKAAEAKLLLVRNKIGYPEKWRDYSKLTVKLDDFAGNVERSNLFEREWNYGKLGKPVDEKEWGMTPPTVNAYYSSSNNDINFPAGILQPPFFDFRIDPAVNFGGIGVVIGHEITHGFDDQGSKYDGHGNLVEWQTPADRKAFTERTDCEVAEYGSFDAAPAHDDVPAQKVNGKLTLGENTADNGGIRIAYAALLATLAEENKKLDAKIDNYTERQRFFLGFAQVWCENRTEQSARQLALTDPHSPGRWRVNGTVQNFEEFGKAFGCKKGAPLYPEKSCRVW